VELFALIGALSEMASHYDLSKRDVKFVEETVEMEIDSLLRERKAA
jgi:hypothetical protein